jgi:hypothetical protein
VARQRDDVHARDRLAVTLQRPQVRPRAKHRPPAYDNATAHHMLVRQQRKSEQILQASPAPNWQIVSESRPKSNGNAINHKNREQLNICSECKP